MLFRSVKRINPQDHVSFKQRSKQYKWLYSLLVLGVSLLATLFVVNQIWYLFLEFINQSSFGLAVASVRNTMPLASMGLSWLVPALVGAVIGLTVHFVRGQKVAQVEDELE